MIHDEIRRDYYREISEIQTKAMKKLYSSAKWVCIAFALAIVLIVVCFLDKGGKG